MAGVGIIFLAKGGSKSMAVVGGILVLAFCATALAGWALGTIFVTRGASLAGVQNEFLSSVSHELRTPLTSIRLFIDTLREERITDAAEKQRCLAIIDQELVRLDGLVGKLDRAVEDRVAAGCLRAPLRRGGRHRGGRARDGEDDGSRRRHRCRRPAGGGPGRVRRPRGVGSGRRQPVEQRLEVHAIGWPAHRGVRGGRPEIRLHLGERQRSRHRLQRAEAHLRQIPARRGRARAGRAGRWSGARPRARDRATPTRGASTSRPRWTRAPASASRSPASFRKPRERSGGGASGRHRRGRRGHRRRAGAQSQASGLPHRGGRATARPRSIASRRCTRTWSCSTSRCPSRAASGCSRPLRNGGDHVPVIVLSARAGRIRQGGGAAARRRRLRHQAVRAGRAARARRGGAASRAAARPGGRRSASRSGTARRSAAHSLRRDRDRSRWHGP